MIGYRNEKRQWGTAGVAFSLINGLSDFVSWREVTYKPMARTTGLVVA